MVVSVGEHVAVAPEGRLSGGIQVSMTVEPTEPGAVDVDTLSVTDVIWAILTAFEVSVGMVIHVWAMVEQSVYLL